MDPDMNKYDLNHRVAHHPKMSDAEWEEAYRDRLGDLLHARAHPHDPAPRRRQSARAGRSTTLTTILWFKLVFKYRGRASARRRRVPAQVPPRPAARPAARKPALVLSALCRRDAGQGLALPGRCIAAPRRCSRRSRPRRTAGPIPTSRSRRRSTNEFEALDLYHATAGGEAALDRKRRDEAIRAGVHAPVRRGRKPPRPRS